MGSRRLEAALALALLLAAGSAAATPSAQERETARRLMDEGKERTRLGDKARALEAYQKAHDLMKVPTTGAALARAHLALGHMVEARDVALEVGRMPRETGEPAVFDKARREAKDLDARLKPRIPTVRIVVKGGPATRVAVDEADVASMLLGEPVALNPGKHVVLARNADGVERHAEIELAERDARDVELVLPAAQPSLILAPIPSSGDAPRAEDKGTQRADGTGKSERTSGASVLVFGGFGVALAGLAVGGITGALTLSKASSVKAQCANGVCDPAAKTELDSASSLATLSTIGFAVAGAGALCGVIGLLLPRTRSEDAIGPRTGAGGAAVWIGPGALGVRGAF